LKASRPSFFAFCKWKIRTPPQIAQITGEDDQRAGKPEEENFHLGISVRQENEAVLTLQLKSNG
jgi:hypothetical protein